MTEKRHVKNYIWEIGNCSTEIIIFKQVKNRNVTEKYSTQREMTNQKSWSLFKEAQITQ